MKKSILTVALALFGICSFAQYKAYEDVKVDSAHVSRTNFVDNWYVGLYAGGLQSWGSFTNNTDYLKKLNVAGALSIGKCLTPVNELRVQFTYGRNTGQLNSSQYGNDNQYHFNNLGVGIDYMPNFTNLFLGFRENRFFQLKGIIGLGGEISFGFSDKWADKNYQKHQANDVTDTYFDKRTSLISIRAGLGATMRLDREGKWKLNVEAIESFLDDSFDGRVSNDKWDGHLNVLVGVSYHFLNKDKKSRDFTYVRVPQEVVNKQNAKLDSLKNIRDYYLANPVNVDVTTEVESKKLYSLIAFDDNKTDIDRLQQTNIYTTAKAWNKAENDLIIITNNSEKDDKLFNDRAIVIAEMLKNRWEIPLQSVKVIPTKAAYNDYIMRKENVTKAGKYIIFIVND